MVDLQKSQNSLNLNDDQYLGTLSRSENLDKQVSQVVRNAVEESRMRRSGRMAGHPGGIAKCDSYWGRRLTVPDRVGKHG